MALLSIEHLTKEYPGKKKAVDDISLYVEEGEIHAFIGPNGAGKTTTIRSIVGLISFSGEIFVDGHSIKSEPLEVKSLISYVPDNPDLYNYMTGLQYLRFVSDVFSLSKSERNERIERLATLFSIKDDLSSSISTYSHGMRQKLALIGAFLHKPKLIILDESFVGLDPESSYHLKGLLKSLCEDGSGVFYSTHVLEQAEKLSDTVSIIKGGKIISSGKMDEVRGDESLEEVFLELTEDDESEE